MNVLKSYKYDYSLHPEAEKFKVTRIMDRPSIFDERARKEYELRDKNCLGNYERRKKKEQKETISKQTANEEKQANSIFKNLIKGYKKKVGSKKNDIPLGIRPGQDIELSQDDCIELSSEEIIDIKPSKPKKKKKAIVNLGDIEISTIDIISEQEVPEESEEQSFDTNYAFQTSRVNKKSFVTDKHTLNNQKPCSRISDDIDRVLDYDYKPSMPKKKNTTKTTNNKKALATPNRNLHERPAPDKAGDSIIEDFIETAYMRLEKSVGIK